MPRTKRRSHFSAASAQSLTEALAEIKRASPHAHDRLAGRLAVTFELAGRDDPGDGPVPYDAVRLWALTHRWCAGPDGGPQRRVALACYAPAADLPGTGRIHFECRRVYDPTCPRPPLGPAPEVAPTAARAAVVLHQEAADADESELAGHLFLPRFWYGFDPRRPPALESTHSPEEWAAAEERVGGLRPWPAEMFARPAGRSYEAHPVDGTPSPWPDGPPAGAEGAVVGGWVVRRGVATPLAQRPSALLATVGHLRGRRVRNPAFAVLRRHGLVPTASGYRAWLDSVSRRGAGGHAIQDPADEASAAGRLRRAIADHVASAPARERALLADLRSACRAVGLRVADGGAGLDDLAELVDNPWARPVVPDALGVQVVRIGEAAGPATLGFSDGVCEVDLDDLGGAKKRYEAMPPWLVREALRRRPGRQTRRSRAASACP